MRKRAIVTLATGSQYYYRMALALMISAYKLEGDKYDYFIYADREKLPYYETPEWLNIIQLSDRYRGKEELKISRAAGFRIKSMVLSDPLIKDHDALFLDADCFIFKSCLDQLFESIEKNSIAIYGGYMPEGMLWGKLDFQEVAFKAGYRVRNMWLNSGFIGRAADEMGLLFVQQYEYLMKNYPFRPFIASRFWQSADEPYLATAFQLAHTKTLGSLPENLPSVSSDFFVTTYEASIDCRDITKPIVHSKYIGGVFQPAIIHFLGGIDIPYYRKLINQTVKFNLEGTLLRPYFRGNYTYKKILYYSKRLTDRTITESRDL